MGRNDGSALKLAYFNGVEAEVEGVGEDDEVLLLEGSDDEEAEEDVEVEVESIE